jgi:penicillin-binding protein 1C
LKVKLKKHRTKLVLAAIFLACIIWFANCVPDPLFSDPACTVLEDADGHLLAGHIAKDGQWRFPPLQHIPEKFEQSILYFEDEYFFYHPGVNPISIFRAAYQNISEQRIVSGGSTLTMQVIRLARKGKPRTVFQKTIEIFMALRMELSMTKEEILGLYATYAPFGGNVVGLEAACWRYYSRAPEKLSWGEMATLAVLPNAPSLIYPGKNQERLLAKRNRLLDKLKRAGIIDDITCELAKAETLPGRPNAMPLLTPHLLTRIFNEGNAGKRIRTTIDKTLQVRANNIVSSYHKALSQNEIHNAALILLDVETSQVLAYVGNSDCKHPASGQDVDVITAPRSTGSILKPFLYAAMLKDGMLLPDALLADVPTKFGSFSPKNFNKKFDGAVPASEALARSLNIPAVRMLRDYGSPRFLDVLKKLNMTTMTQSAEHYGLSLILGGAEASLWDLSSAYLSMARALKNYERNNFGYDESDQQGAYFMAADSTRTQVHKQTHLFGAGPIWLTFKAMKELNRPREEQGWEDFQSAADVAWKTGTSFGHRDAWAIGMNTKYLVGIWVGNADGEGRPGLTGLNVAAPILFKMFKHLPNQKWYDTPFEDLSEIEVCKRSGFAASETCITTEKILGPVAGNKSPICTYHKRVHLAKDGKYRVTSKCYEVANMVDTSWFVLPPIQEWYFKRKDPFYKTLPPMSPDCGEGPERSMDVIYPKRNTKIFVPRNLKGEIQKTIFEVAHRRPTSTVYWHVDEEFVGSTTVLHKLELAPAPGRHLLTLVDESGESLALYFEILEK